MVNKIEFYPTPQGLMITTRYSTGKTLTMAARQTERPCANPQCGHSQFWHNPGCTYVDKKTGDQCTCSWYE